MSLLNDLQQELHREALMEHQMAVLQTRKRQAPRFAAGLLASAVWLVLIVRAWYANNYAFSGLLIFSALGLAAFTWVLWAFFWGFPLYSAQVDAVLQIRHQMIAILTESLGYEKVTSLTQKQNETEFKKRVAALFAESGFYSDCNQYISEDPIFRVELPDGGSIEWVAAKGNAVINNGSTTRFLFTGLLVAVRWNTRLPWLQEEVILINEKIPSASRPFKPAADLNIPLFEQHPATGLFIYANQPTKVYERLNGAFWLKLKEMWGADLWEEGAKCLAVCPDGLYFTFDRYDFFNYCKISEHRADLESELYVIRMQRQLNWILNLAKLKELL